MTEPITVEFQKPYEEMTPMEKKAFEGMYARF